METEKVYQEKTARTIQQKQDGSGTLQFVDNRPMNPVLQRVGEDEEDALQGKFEQPLQREEDDEAMQGKFEEPVQKKNETGMPDNLKAGIEDLSGFAMDDVRVHYTIAAFLGTWLTRFTTLFRSTSRLRIIRRICLSYTYLACTGISIPGSCFPHASLQF